MSCDVTIMCDMLIFCTFAAKIHIKNNNLLCFAISLL